MKYCNRCGALVSQSEAGEVKASEKRFDEYLDGLFWITVFGLAFILGGAVLLKKVNLRDAFIVAYLALSTTVFLINFGLSLWGAFRIAHNEKEAKRVREFATRSNTKELLPMDEQSILPPVPSVTEQTTRSLEPVHRRQTE